MVNNKGLAYSIEVMLAFVVLILFILGSSTPDTGHDWSEFQDQVAAEDLGHTLKQTGDLDRMMKDGNTGSLETVAETVSSGQLQLSGSIENLPLDEASIAINARPEDIAEESLKPLDDYDECDTDDLGEIQTDEEIYVTEEDADDKPRIYVVNTTLNTTEEDSVYDSIYVDNQTDCQLESDQGPFLRDEIFNWKNSTDGSDNDYREFKHVDIDEEQLVLHQADRAYRLRDVMEERVVEVETDQSFTTVELSETSLSEYNVLLFDSKDSLDQLENNRQKVDRFLEENTVIMMMDLESDDFEDGFISETGMEWVDLDYTSSPDQGVAFGDRNDPQRTETYFLGRGGDPGEVDIGTGGKVSSSKSQTALDQNNFVIGDTGRYDTDEWTTYNHSMVQEDPADYDHVPESECIEEGTEDPNFTVGEFEFPGYQGHLSGNPETVTYTVLNTKLGSDDDVCENRNIRAATIVEKEGDDDFEYRGHFLVGEEFILEGKEYSVSYPDQEALENGEELDFINIDNPEVEKINLRNSFPDQEIDTLARIPHRDEYNEDSRKLIAGLIHHSIGDQNQFGEQERTGTTSTVYSGFQNETYIPYKVSMRWH